MQALLSEAVEFYVDPEQEAIGASIVVVLGLISFIVDMLMIYKTYNIGWRNFCNFCRCYGASNDFKKMVWMRFFEFTFEVLGMILGSIGIELLLQRRIAGLGHQLAISVIAVIGALIFGLIGKYLGNIIGYVVARYTCYKPHR